MPANLRAGKHLARDTATIAGFGGPPPPIRMRLTSWKPHRAGALRGFATLRLPCSLLLIECPVFVKNGKAWANLPAKPTIGRDGHQVIAGTTKQYSPAASWPDRATQDRWSAAVVELVRRADPGIFTTQPKQLDGDHRRPGRRRQPAAEAAHQGGQHAE